jgi:Zn-dependent protease with chaperone function
MVLAAVVTVLAFGAAGWLASAITAACWRSAALRARLLESADSLFALRLLPGVFGLGFAFLLALPAFVAFEPENAGETPGVSLLLLACALAAPTAWGVRRALRAAASSLALQQRLLRDARPAPVSGSVAPAHETASDSPAVAVVGFLRPRLLISRRVRRLLTRAELLAVVAHENAHVLRRDNLRQWLLRAAPDWLGTWGPARELESAWAEAAEREADARAAPGPEAALALASALVAVARLSLEAPPPALGVSALHSGSAEALRRRVLRLTDARAAARPRLRLAGWLGLAVGTYGALAPLARPESLASLHAVIEVLVRSLP